jgi:protein-L-isoaspartate O-methyltransferase
MKRFAAAALALGLSAAQAEPTEWRVPFITTPPEVVERMLHIAGTRADDLVIDLGSGDGRIVIAAAKSYGARGIGIELDGVLVERSIRNAELAKVSDKVRFVQGDVLVADISRATVVTAYLLPALMVQLQPRFIDELAPGTRIVSHAFTMAGWAPDRTETVQLERRHFGQGNESRLHLWIVPADVRGVWRAPGAEFRIEQNFQKIDVTGASSATISGRDIAWSGFRGRVEGNRIVGELEGRPVVLER